MNFGRAERARYLSDILPIYGDFLRKCYSKFIVFQEFTLCLLASKAPQECQSRAIPDIEGFERMVDMEVDPDSFVNVDPVPERTQSDTVPDIPMPPSPACARFRSPTPFSPSHRPSPPPSRDGSLAPSQAPSPKAQLPVAPIPLSSAPLEVDMNGDPSPALSRDESIPRSRTASVGVDVEAAIEAESVGAATRPPLVTAPAQTTRLLPAFPYVQALPHLNISQRILPLPLTCHCKTRMVPGILNVSDVHPGHTFPQNPNVPGNQPSNPQ
jgi:hypothetical protein